ncbi:hypothetical protein HZ326_0929 [Fusarium oxysporum f. sp. albedinis]|nr:hypothetical protein HZ326_0929 [Fusarium oxysporum f. sp. albedinis]
MIGMYQMFDALFHRASNRVWSWWRCVPTSLTADSCSRYPDSRQNLMGRLAWSDMVSSFPNGLLSKHLQTFLFSSIKDHFD